MGVDVAADPNVFREGKRLVTKLRNAARLVLGFDEVPGTPGHPLDRALMARLTGLVGAVTERWAAWDHAGALALTETWFWSDFCDNYLELSKTRAYDADPSALATLRAALDVVVRLFAPFIPFATEEVWSSLHPGSGSIHRAAWPKADDLPDGEDDGAFDVAVSLLTQIRKAKSEAKVSIKTPVERMIVTATPRQLELFARIADDLLATANVIEHETQSDGALEEPLVRVTLGTPDR